jgi:exopolysaccharide biosynthesis polyprenyl glycosylphosphotransferase
VIPRRFFWLFDTLAVSAAFAAARLIAPFLQADLAPGGRIRPLLDALRIPPPDAIGAFQSLREMFWIFLVMTAATIISMEMLGGYRPILHQSRTRIVGTALMAPMIGLGLITLMLFTLRNLLYSRLFVLLFSLLCVAILTAYRLALRSYRRQRVRAGYNAMQLVVVGSPESVRWMEDYFDNRLRPAEYRIWGHLDLDGEPGDVHRPGPPRRDRRLGVVSQLGDLLVHQPVHEVIAIHGSQQSDWLRTVVQQCDYFRVTLRIVPEALLLGTLRDLELLYHGDPLRLPQVVLRPPELDSDALFLKRLADIAISGALLVMLAPIFLAIVIALKIHAPHLPIFYRWRVVGYKGQPFTGYKFTTMTADADARRGELGDRNEMTGPVFKIKNDPRVTTLGRFLRRYSLNELPQLWSVLKGDMSLVGPRPAFPHELERYELWHKRKLCVKPGITCLWQVRGRNRISNFDDWVRMDLEYIDNWSLWLDFKILVRTAWAVGAGTGS